MKRQGDVGSFEFPHKLRLTCIASQRRGQPLDRCSSELFQSEALAVYAYRRHGQVLAKIVTAKDVNVTSFTTWRTQNE